MFKDGSEKISSRQAFLYSWRGIKLLHKILPFNLVRNIVNNTLWGIMPLLTKGLARSSNLYEYFEKTFVNAHAAAGKDVRIFNFQNSILHTVKKFFSAWLFTHNVFAQNNGIAMAVSAIFLVLSYLVIGLRALEGMYDIGEVVRLVGAITAFYTATAGVMVFLSNLKDNAPFWECCSTFSTYQAPNTKAR